MNSSQDTCLQPIELDAHFCFHCHPELSCFNLCCHDLIQFLYPYDILRLKKHLATSSTDFLKAYCLIYDGESSGLPVVSLKPDPNRQHACPFLCETGCIVYEDRPASCRIFPLARGLVRNRISGCIEERYARIPDPLCKGFESDQSIHLKDWLASQDMDKFNRMNDAMMPLISLKNQLRPGPLPLREREIFITGCYDLDRFRKKHYETGALTDLFSKKQLMHAADSDEALLLLGMDWVRIQLFGEIK
ncbi:YkgJ family cysteine cluster protein [Desulfobotulus sp. H1]|uniref:YkgJ family cysteine cluster protein n=1 Tax=Desulfobotulus pelophilus TaxID=2823377 RepID=A0ABT3NCH2_9BACT|nr:YkgJ family cysteine cluster protein [Desulfobotulus pelophilus]MCW7755165.1 YkgJ family cysteine cluster protein [Desulfobotulus pelophilus]